MNKLLEGALHTIRRMRGLVNERDAERLGRVSKGSLVACVGRGMAPHSVAHTLTGKPLWRRRDIERWRESRTARVPVANKERGSWAPARSFYENSDFNRGHKYGR